MCNVEDVKNHADSGLDVILQDDLLQAQCHQKRYVRVWKKMNKKGLIFMSGFFWDKISNKEIKIKTVKTQSQNRLKLK